MTAVREQMAAVRKQMTRRRPSGYVAASRGQKSPKLEFGMRPSAMQSAGDWCKYLFINQIFKLTIHQFQGIAGREVGEFNTGAKLFLSRGIVEGLLKENEHPPAMRSAMG